MKRWIAVNWFGLLIIAVGGEREWVIHNPATRIHDKTYKVGPFIGNGNQGNIFFGWDTWNTRLVAIKCFRNKVGFLSEVAFYKDVEKWVASRNVEYPRGIPKMYQATQAATIPKYSNAKQADEGGRCQKENFPFSKPESESRKTYNLVVVLELLGKDIGRLIQEHPDKKFGFDNMKKIGRQLLDTLKVVYQLGYIHTDLSPNNLMVGRISENANSRVFIVDFGNAVKIAGPRYAKDGLNSRLDLKKVGTSLLEILGYKSDKFWSKGHYNSDNEILDWLIRFSNGLKTPSMQRFMTRYFTLVSSFDGDFHPLVDHFKDKINNEDLD